MSEQQPQPDRALYVVEWDTLDPNEGVLYWNNQNGWGHRLDATVFTATEKESFDLPNAGGEDCKWVGGA